MNSTMRSEDEIINSILTNLEELKIPSLSKLNDMIREKFGLNNTNFVSSSDQEEKKEENKTFVSLILTKIGDQRIPVFNVIKEIIGKNILEVKNLTSTLPFTILSGLDQQKAEELKEKIESKGAEVEIK